MLVQGKRYAVFSLLDRYDKTKEGQDIPGTKDTIWTRAGSAWINKDGSMNLILDVLPLGGRLHVREQADKKDEKSSTTATGVQQQPQYAAERVQQQPQQYQPFADADASMGGH